MANGHQNSKNEGSKRVLPRDPVVVLRGEKMSLAMSEFVS